MNLSAYIFRTIATFLFAFLLLVKAQARHAGSANHFFFQDTTIRFPVKDRRSDTYSNPARNSFDFRDTSFVKKNIEYDPKTKQYYIVEKTGNSYYRTPISFSMQEFINLQGKKDELDYFKKRSNMLSSLNRKIDKPRFRVKPDWFNRIVGTGKVEIKPSGYVDLLAGYQGQKIQNPTLPERARNNGGFDFNMNSQLQVDGNIGDKLKLPINYNTLANFDFENQLKLDYQGKSDEILKVFKAGNVEFNSKGSLIPGAQALFGLKTQFQFGKLFITSVLANQRSQRQTLGLQGGSASQIFSLKADDYEENRHFLLSQYFNVNFNKAMKQLPVVNSPVQIQRIEVWVTNRQGATTDTRDIAALMDLGDGQPYGPWGGTGTNNTLPSNGANSLYGLLTNNPANRNSSTVQNFLTSNGLVPVQDFEKTYARKLQPTDYYYNPQIGFVSLNQPLQPDEILGVAFQYTYNGRVYQVGEFSTDVPPDTTGTTQNVLFLKLLKATSQRTYLPIWDLMMKNVYSVGFGQLERQDFKLDVVYEEPSLGEKRYLPPDNVSDPYKGQPILSLTNLDRLNNQLDPQTDGIFDFIEGFTVISSQSRIIFPLLQPFGHDLDYIYTGTDSTFQRKKYLYYPLYDTIKAIAQTYANLNRFKITGKSKSAVSSDYQLGFNIPRGSVTVSAGGQLLQENIDYEINYDLGTLRVTNQAIVNSGIPVSIQFENQGAFALQQKNLMAARFDYLAGKKLSLGATIVRLGERPFFVKQNYGDDPIRNTMYGFDLDYRSNIPRLSKWLDKLPFYSTKENSGITANIEAAVLKPGHAPQIGKNEEGVIYIDDFEGTRAPVDLRFPLISWNLASTPQKSPNQFNVIQFPEADLINNLDYGNNRAKLSWYNIESVLQERGNPNNPLRNNLPELSKPETRQVFQNEIFPKRSVEFGQGLLTTFDLSFQPKEKGPYNFEYRNGRIDANGKLLNPRNAWGGIMRNIDQIDFESGNVEFIEFWLQDPFIKNTITTNGELYFNLGNISEDILRDGKRMYENGLPTSSTPNIPVDINTVWGRVPANPLQVTNAFTNNIDERVQQDAGFDGLADTAEVNKQSAYLANLAAVHGTGSPVYQKALADPSADNFVPYRSPVYDNAGSGILERYKHINNPQGNSPAADNTANNNPQFVNAFTQYPDQEDLNRDNTMNEVEEYFQYRIALAPNMAVGSNFITDKRRVTVNPVDGSGPRDENWYLFRIPVSQYQAKVGNIPDFKSIRFIRMFVTGFNDSITLRFGKLELVRNQWRKFQYKIDTLPDYVNLPANDPVVVNTLAVNLEENDQRTPIRYVTPPGIERQQQLGSNNVQLFLNEQSLSLKFCGLPKKQARGLFKTMNLDMRQYGKLKMFIHAEKAPLTDLNDNELNAIVRIGSDAISNYYEIKIPLKLTLHGETDSFKIWPAVNDLDFDLSELTRLKTRRNKSGTPNSQYYFEPGAGGKSYAIIGNPNLGEVRIMLLAVESVVQEAACGELWFNELRFSNLDEKGGWAAVGRVDLKLADLGSITMSGTAKSRGFGTLEQRVNERSREDFYSFDLSANIEAGKLLPKKLGIQIPVYAGISRQASTPEYDPYVLDLKLKDIIKEAAAGKGDSIKRDAQTVTTIKTFNLTNVKKLKTDGKKPLPWSVTNLDLNYSYLETQSHDPLIENDLVRRTRGALAYNYAPQTKPVLPFKKLIRSNSKWLTPIKDFNFNYAPSQISVRADVFRQFGALRPRNVGGGPYKIPETYNKYFTFDRYYIMQWNLTNSISMDYMATNNARIDEPFGRIDTKEKKDSVRKNLFKGGRNTQFQQNVTLTYNVPTKKFPFLDWTSMTATYNAKYNWQAASLLARTLGNTLGNTQTKNINAELKFEDLYDKWKFLRAVNTPSEKKPASDSSSRKNKNDKSGKGDNKNAGANPTTGKNDLPSAAGKTISLTDSTGKKKTKKQIRKERRAERKAARLAKKDPNKLPEVGAVPKAFFQVLTSVKTASIRYTEDFGTTLPGYLDSTRNFGHNFKSRQPGWDFIFGYQPDTNYINKLGSKGLFSRDSLVSAMIQQRYTQTLGITAQISPFRDFIIDLNLDKSYNKQYSELYKDTSGVAGLRRLSPYAAGSFNISYIAFKTLFKPFNPNEVSETFKQFEAYRADLSLRLKGLNPYAGSNPIGPDGFVQGYGRYAQDVVIPAFLAAYTGKDPSTIKLIKNNNPNLRSNPFSGLIPKPNWSVTYNGLSRLPGLDKVFTNFNLRHGYHSTLSMNSFNTALLFLDPFSVAYPSFRDPLTGNYVPFFLVPNITIQESFDPLIELDMTFTNQMTFRVEYRKTRQLSLSLIDYQLAENRSEEITVGFNWRKRGVPFLKNMKIGKNGEKLDNDITFKFDFSLRDDATANTKLDQNTSFGTAGQKVIRIAPSIDYILNKRVSLKLYFEQNRNIPKISNSFPITNTRGGLQVRISLSQ